MLQLRKVPQGIHLGRAPQALQLRRQRRAGLASGLGVRLAPAAVEVGLGGLVGGLHGAAVLSAPRREDGAQQARDRRDPEGPDGDAGLGAR